MSEVIARTEDGHAVVECPFCSSREICRHYVGLVTGGLQANMAFRGKRFHGTRTTDVAVNSGKYHDVYRKEGA